MAAATGGWGTMRRLRRSADLITLDTCENYSKLALSENEDSAACHNSDRRFRSHFATWLRQQEFAKIRMLL